MNNKELVLKEMFGKNESYAGYDNICNKLIETGNCITTIHSWTRISDIFIMYYPPTTLFISLSIACFS